MEIVVRGIDTAEVERLRAGGVDANGQPPLVELARGPANPCRHCLQLIEEGEPMLVLSWRPFPERQPYAETGPIFLHAGECPRYEARSVPDWFVYLDPAIVRGYDARDWIRYETGQVVAGPEIATTCRSILADPQVVYVHVRSRFNCFQCRVQRDAG